MLILGTWTFSKFHRPFAVNSGWNTRPTPCSSEQAFPLLSACSPRVLPLPSLCSFYSSLPPPEMPSPYLHPNPPYSVTEFKNCPSVKPNPFRWSDSFLLWTQFFPLAQVYISLYIMLQLLYSTISCFGSKGLFFIHIFVLSQNLDIQ